LGIQQTLSKWKACFCARGKEQLIEIDFFETYAPVVQWTTIRLNVHVGNSPWIEVKPNNLNGEAASGAFSYSSVVGYASVFIWTPPPDITFAVNCCAWHSSVLSIYMS
jgi:hypothetical protein